MATRLLVAELRREPDLVATNQRLRVLCGLCGFDRFDQARIGTALSEIGRNALLYAGGGTVEVSLEEGTPQVLLIEVADQGGGIAELDRVLAGAYKSRTGAGLGITGARRMMDELVIDTSRAGTRVTLRKRLPRRAPALSAARLAQIEGRLGAAERDAEAGAEVERLAQELLERDRALVTLTRELEDTNRGVVALYAELDERSEYQKRATELKTRLLSDMGHELRTPLHSIQTVAQFLLDRLDGPLTPEQERQVRIIHKTAEDLTEFVNDLLDLARAEAGRAAVRVAEVPVPRLFGALRGMLRPLAERSTVQLVFEAAAELPPLVTDEQKVSQILRNFISNALKFTERGEVRVSAAHDPMLEVVTFAVADTGIGIDPADHAAIFEEFMQVEGPLQRRYRGSGLGLPLTRRLAGLLGGEVGVSSALGTGATFWLRVPRVLAGEAALSPAQPRSFTPAQPLGGRVRSLLVIDDEEASRYVLRRLLGDRYQVLEAATALEGVARAAADQPDGVFLDLALPDRTGFEVLATLRADPRTAHIPVAIYTAKLVDAADRARLTGAVTVLRKSTASREADRAGLEEALIALGVARREEAS